jgi:hypothetical protein
MVQVGHVVNIINDTQAKSIKVDVIGIGWGVAGRLDELRREGAHNATVVKVNVGSASTRPARFPKLRDQIWWEVGRQLTEDGGWDLSAIDDVAVAQLTAPKYQLDSSGRVKVEPKADTRARIGRSPDDADALLLAFFTGAGQGVAFMQAYGREVAGRDPTPEQPTTFQPVEGVQYCRCPSGKRRFQRVGDRTICGNCGGDKMED